jgi:hypothetical protein
VKAYSPEPMVGDVWEDCDKRTNGRRCRVVSIDDGKATMQHICGFPTTRVSVRRMYPHSTGWRLVERATNTSSAATE